MIFRNIAIFLTLWSILSCNSSLSKKEKESYLNKGNEVAQASFNELSGLLKVQMEDGGTMQAIPFCNVQALPITKALSEKFNVSIKRTSDKLRNQQNRPTERELEIIHDYKRSLADNEQLTPIVELDINSEKHYYAPILMQAKCLVCHGKPNESINSKTDSIIKALYPKDMAFGYTEGDLRGIWSITFKN